MTTAARQGLYAWTPPNRRTRCLRMLAWRRGFRRRTCAGPGGSMPRSSGSSRWRSGRVACCTGPRAAILPSSRRPVPRLARSRKWGCEVDDLDATVADLKERGVVFEDYDLPGLETADGIAEVAGNYPSKGGKGERAAWFRDSEGNMLGIGQRIS